MRTLLGIVLALAVVVGTLPGVVAQEAASAFVDGVGQKAVYAQQGEAVAALSVTDVDDDFRDFPDGQYPDHGYTYRAVSFEIENMSDSAIIVEPSHFVLYDSFGNSHYHTSMRLGDESTNQHSNRYALAPGEVAAPIMVFSVPVHTESALFTWQPEHSTLVIVNLLDSETDPGAVIRGLNTPAGITDDFGNVYATIQITDITQGWDEYSDYDAPEAGETYWAVFFSITNESDRPMEVSAYRFYVVDEQGSQIQSSMARSHDDAAYEVFRSAEVAPGETLEGQSVFIVSEASEPTVFLWENYGGSAPIIILTNDSDVVPVDSATPTGQRSSGGNAASL